MNYEAVLAGLPDAVIAVDTSLTVIFWNAAAEALTERSQRRAQGRLLKEVFPAEASVVRRLAETLALGEGRSEPEGIVETPDRRPIHRCDTLPRWWRNSGTPGSSSGRRSIWRSTNGCGRRAPARSPRPAPSLRDSAGVRASG
jgi:PAS domain-containing protein